jgi:PIN domain nuclease of toxin-antitoxin system
MKYLLDSGVWLWSIASVELIGKRGLEVLSDSQQEIYFSAASAWELSIKAHLRKLTLPYSWRARVCVLCP